jgi:hypothetical protein
MNRTCQSAFSTTRMISSFGDQSRRSRVKKSHFENIAKDVPFAALGLLRTSLLKVVPTMNECLNIIRHRVIFACPSCCAFSRGRMRPSKNLRNARSPCRLTTFQRRLQRVCETAAAEKCSNGDDVGAMFFLMRYQTVAASRREINLARQFCRVNLVHRMEINVARHPFEVIRLPPAFISSLVDFSSPRIISHLP